LLAIIRPAEDYIIGNVYKNMLIAMARSYLSVQCAMTIQFLRRILF
jgi:hypothetical protein